jgi:hypothetical protein
MQPRLIVLLASQLMTADDLHRLTAPPPDARVQFGDDPLQVGELRLPDGPGSHPVAIVIHGGCWLAEYDMTHIRALGEALTREASPLGYWSIDVWETRAAAGRARSRTPRRAPTTCVSWPAVTLSTWNV